MEAALVAMPFADLERPSLALGQLTAVLSRAGIESRVWEASLDLAARVGLGEYMQMMTLLKGSFFGLSLGDFVYAPLAFPGFGEDVEPLVDIAAAEFRAFGRHFHQGLRRGLRDGVLGMRRAAADHLDVLVDDLLDHRPRIVGCTSTFQQHAASLALLRRIRARDPRVATVMGGANCETVMGRVTHARFHWVDYVVSGEADGLVAPLFRGILDGAVPPLHGVFTPRHRDTGYEMEVSRWRATYETLDALPTPDYHDYFTRLQNSPLASAIDVGLPLETSRGCWWGAVHHCTFCGLNGGGLAYRSKSADRVLDDLAVLAEWDNPNVYVVDNILDMKYIDSLLPRLRGFNLFFETKSNLRGNQIRALKTAGVNYVQPGIESLDSRLLALVDKGAKGVQQVQFLKHARSTSMVVYWNLLYDIPGADDAWYAEQAALFPLLVHLQPPSLVTPLLYDRYSPYFEDASRWGLRLRVPPAMSLAWPLDPFDLWDLCYHFERDGATAGPGVHRLQQAVAEWQRLFSRQRPMLSMEDEGDALRIRDSRPCAGREETVLRGVARAVYLACDDAQPLSAVARAVGAPADELREPLQRLCDDKLMLSLDDRFLSLAVRGTPPPWPTRSPMGKVDARRAKV